MSTLPSKTLSEIFSTGAPFVVTELLDALLSDAVVSGASDVHIDPTEGDIRIRYRVDGELEDVARIPKQHHLAIISRIKVLSELRTDEHQAAQDGRFRVVMGNAAVDIRVAVSPTYYGERAVLRMLTQSGHLQTLMDLGMAEAEALRVERVVKRPHGMVLASGPTGSGKTTTLYSLLHLVNKPTVSIVSVEDPVEYAVTGINQIQVNARTSLTFATGLRSILRQDPNVIMVGEIRDAETARLATNTALTGHLLLSTIHTNDAATALLRLMDLGVEQYLVSSTVSVVIAQRLVRTVCSSCVELRVLAVHELPAALRAFAGSGENIEVCEGRGCVACRKSGYKGRTALFEVLIMSPTVKALVLRRVPASEITRQAAAEGMRAMAYDGMEKIRRKLTTPEEVLRVLSE